MKGGWILRLGVELVVDLVRDAVRGALAPAPAKAPQPTASVRDVANMAEATRRRRPTKPD
jgi:hypothetical protein